MVIKVDKSEGFIKSGKTLITEVQSDRYMRKQGKRKGVQEEELFDKEDYCEGEFIPGFHD
tara:strand:- start:2059 stop:2238 length:180 start_codon:yes stop_codon:yes gene_type:complete